MASSSKITLALLNEYLCNRRIKKFRYGKDKKIILIMADGRKVIFTPGDDTFYTIRIKYENKYLTGRELEEFNHNVNTCISNLKKSMPRECRSCIDPLDLTP